MSQPISGSLYKRVSSFITNDLALIAYHIPLDANNPYGNNYGIAKRIGLRQLEPFGTWHGMTIGVKGVLEDSMTIDELSQKAVRTSKMPTAIVRFGKKKISTVGIISGGASDEVEDAVKEGLDCYIT